MDVHYKIPMLIQFNLSICGYRFFNFYQCLFVHKRILLLQGEPDQESIHIQQGKSLGFQATLYQQIRSSKDVYFQKLKTSCSHVSLVCLWPFHSIPLSNKLAERGHRQGQSQDFLFGGPNFGVNILVSSQNKPSHTCVNIHTQI